MPCPKCGGTMVGDGFSTVRHCEFSDDFFDVEPDAEPILCNYPHSSPKINMYYSLFLDDERKPLQVTWIDLPPVEWMVVKNYAEFQRAVLEESHRPGEYRQHYRKL